MFHRFLGPRAVASRRFTSVVDGLRRIRRQLDSHVVGHDTVKNALILALVAREHVYLEGPPGAAKTMMAEVAARTAGESFWFYQFHRDTKMTELVGDEVLVREHNKETGGEVIRQANQRVGCTGCTGLYCT